MVFDECYEELRAYMGKYRANSMQVDKNLSWPLGKRSSIVLTEDTAIELGHPQTDSAAFILLTDDKNKVKDGQVTVIGPDLNETNQARLPFGKVIILAVDDYDHEQLFDRYAELDQVRHTAILEGYMLRAVPQDMREWSRISRQAVKRGINFQKMASAIYDQYHAQPGVSAVETVFVTEGTEAVAGLKTIGTKVGRIVAAMNKMAFEMHFDCHGCEFEDVCEEVGELRKMRDAHKKA
ncbi:MAG: acetyl-CoA decarbonylase/synthase complex subunit beta [Deltaproteobacteria bacterium ADurb.Bin510]|nr:MAG: acetyl-CoA decarbonylase/synthase complex subunit beta [Deltaproteobacteria bacterium ADurb.Bin510]